MAMGGRVAEEIVFGHRTTGAANDLEQATGIGPAHGAGVGHERPHRADGVESQQQVFLGEDLMTGQREYCDDTARLIDEEVGPHPARRRRTGPRRCSPSTAAASTWWPRRCSRRRRSTAPRSAALVQQGLTPEPIPTPSA